RVPLPVTEQLFEEILTLPLYYELTDDQVDEVIAAVKELVGAAG
ncbi:MAG: DegT/DnrJ/EryC1/StrS aminotransferase family protein, partial [Chloroflexi bacterium]|nr:DegT/DnrJ/EryC1/StrS aminotransferase family protein [Chloroflexota bacterium]